MYCENLIIYIAFAFDKQSEKYNLGIDRFFKSAKKNGSFLTGDKGSTKRCI